MPTTNERRVVVGPSSVVCGGRHSSEEAGGAGPASSSAWLDNLLSLPCPRTGSRLQCALASDGQTLCEVQRFKERFTSWLVGETVVQDGTMYWCVHDTDARSTESCAGKIPLLRAPCVLPCCQGMALMTAQPPMRAANIMWRCSAKDATLLTCFRVLRCFRASPRVNFPAPSRSLLRSLSPLDAASVLYPALKEARARSGGFESAEQLLEGTVADFPDLGRLAKAPCATRALQALCECKVRAHERRDGAG